MLDIWVGSKSASAELKIEIPQFFAQLLCLCSKNEESCINIFIIYLWRN